ncbi:MAG: YIP1 family protein [Nitrospirae bacterium]|nr:YIP1 family protein [Nitrospirota bacterium]
MEKAKGIDFAAIPQTAIRVITSPAAFFREMPKAGGFVEPLIFAVVMGIAGGLIQTVLHLAKLQLAVGMGMGLASIIIMPIVIAVFSFIGAAILFVIWKLMGSQESYETAYRCGAYLTALTPITTILGIIPYAGSAIGLVIMTFYLVVASVEVHKIPAQKAWLVFGILAAIFIAMSISAQFAAKRMATEALKWQKEAEEASKVMQKQAEEMQKAAEEMQKNMGQQSEEAKKAAEEMQKQMEQMQKQMQKK